MAEATKTEIVAYDQTLFPMLRETDPEAVQARMAAQMFKAESIEDLFGVLNGTLSRDLVGQAVDVRSVAWQPYESDRGTIPLAVVEAVKLETGELVEFATTSTMLVAFLRQAEIIGALPFTARITSKKTRGGNMALNFENS